METSTISSKLKKYCKLIPMFISVFVLVFFIPIESKAFAPSAYHRVNMNRPTVTATSGYIETLNVNGSGNDFAAVHFYQVFDEDGVFDLEIQIFMQMIQFRSTADRVQVFYASSGQIPVLVKELGTEYGLYDNEIVTLWDCKAYHFYGPAEVDYLVDLPLYGGNNFVCVYDNEVGLYESLISLVSYLEREEGWTNEQIQQLLNAQNTITGQFDVIVSELQKIYPVLVQIEGWLDYIYNNSNMWFAGIHNMLVELIYSFNADDPLDSIEDQKDKIESADKVESDVKDELQQMEEQSEAIKEQVDQTIEEGKVDTTSTWNLVDALLNCHPKLMSTVLSCLSIAVIGLIFNR